MKKVLTLSLLALCVSHGAAAANYALNNDNIALLFDDTNSTVVVKDNKANHPLTPQELFFLTLPDESKIHTADFKIKHVEKQDNAIVIDFTHPDFNVTVKLNLVKGKYANIGYTIAAVGQPRDVAKITFFPTQKQSQAPYVDGAINSSPIVADSFFILPDKPIVNTYAYEATTNLNVELKTPIQPEAPVSFTTWFGTFPETSQLRRSVNQFINDVRPRPYKPYLHYNSWMDIGFFTPYTEQDVLGRMDEWNKEFITGRGVALDAFLLDDGWDDLTGPGYLARHSETVLAKYGRKPTACTAPLGYGFHRGVATTNRATFAFRMQKSMGSKPWTANWRCRERTTLKTSMSGSSSLSKTSTSPRLNSTGWVTPVRISKAARSPQISMHQSPCCTICAAQPRICLST